MKLISTRAHGILDLVTVGTLDTLPWLLNWRPRTKSLVAAASASMLGYSLGTRYELGLVKLLPMKTHLLLDYAAGVMLAGAALRLPRERLSTRLALVGLGLNEIAVAALTEPTPPVAEQATYAYLSLAS